MKKNIIAFATFATCLSTLFVSCEKEATSTVPTFSNITVTPNPAKEGDTLTAVVNFASNGENWYFFKQSFSVKGIGQIYNNTKSENNYLPSVPTCKFIAPKAGKYEITFQSTVSLTAGTVLYSSLPECKGEFTVE